MLDYKNIAEAELKIKEAFNCLGVFKLMTHKSQHIADTPKRIVKAWMEYLENLSCENKIKITTFTSNSDQLVLVKDIAFSSLCSHHFFPFHGICHVAYLPSEEIIGLSKIPRIVQFYAKQPQVQEELTSEIAEELNNALKPRFVMVIMEAIHTCCRDRGVSSNNSMITNEIRHSPKLSSDSVRSIKTEVLDLIKLNK